MKHLKKFENFYLNDENLENDPNRDLEDENRDDFQGLLDDSEDEDSECSSCEDDGDEKDVKDWGDESLEEKKSSKIGLTDKQKKLPISLQKAILKRMSKKK